MTKPIILVKSMLYVLVKAPPRVCTENIALGGVSKQIQHEDSSLDTPPCAVFSVQMSVSGALTDI